MPLHVSDRERERARQPLRSSTDSVDSIAAQFRVPVRKQLRPVVWRSERQRLVGDLHELDLELGIERQDLLPTGSGFASSDKVAESGPDIARQHPPAFPREELRQAFRSPVDEQRRQRGFERVCRRILLEPSDAVRGRNPDDRRPCSRVDELRVARPLDALVDPRGRVVEPAGLVPS
jgi:hypothetical protein